MKKQLLTLTLTSIMISSEIFAGGTVRGKVDIDRVRFGRVRKKSNRSNVVVFIENLRGNKRERKTLLQKKKKFSPRVLPIVAGGIVEFPNKDPYNHNVFSPTKGITFDLGYMGYNENKKVQFKRVGAVRVYCNIHSKMVADILVVPNRYYAKTGRNGKFKIKNIPPGTYTFVAWQPLGAAEKKNIRITNGRVEVLNFKIRETVFKVTHKNKFGQAYEKDY